MGRQHIHFPIGLDRAQFDRLTALVEQAVSQEPSDLLRRAEEHLKRARQAYASNRMVNIRLATAIVGQFSQVVVRWKNLPVNDRNWLAGSMLYFITARDSEPDFDSPNGFEDDTEVLNACLRSAKQDDLCLKVEDYDGA